VWTSTKSTRNFPNILITSRCLLHCACPTSKDHEEDLIHTVEIHDKFKSAEEKLREADKKLCELEGLTVCDAECEAHLKEQHAYYIDCEDAYWLEKKYYHDALRRCQLKDTCDMTCVKECSFWSWSPWTDCFTECGCTHPPHDLTTKDLVMSNYNGGEYYWKA